MRKRFLFLATVASAVIVTALTVNVGAGANSAGYRLIANLTGPNAPFFKAPPGSLVPDIVWVDPALHRVYLSDESNEKPGTFGRVVGAVDAWDTRTFKWVGAMFGPFTGLKGFPASFDTEGPDGLLVDGLGHIWAGNGNDQIAVGNARTMKLIAVVTTGEAGRADELAYDPVNKTVLVTNPGASPPGWTLIDAKTFRVLGHATLGSAIPSGSIEQPQFDPVIGKFVSSVSLLTSKDTHGGIAIVNTDVTPGTTKVAAKVYPLPVACGPLGLTIGPGRDIFQGCLGAGPVITSVKPGGTGLQFVAQIRQACCGDEVWYDSHLDRYYAANFLNPNMTGKDPVVTVVDARTHAFITNIRIFTDNLAPDGTVRLEPDISFHSVAADPTTGYVYVPTATGVRVFAASAG